MERKPLKLKPITKNSSTDSIKPLGTTENSTVVKERRSKAKKATPANPVKNMTKIVDVNQLKLKPTTKDSPANSNKPLEVTATSTVLKKRRYRGKKASPDNPAESIKKSVANVKRSKEIASGNWQAFLASGLLQSEKSENPKPKRIPKTTQASTRQTENQPKKSQAQTQIAKSNSTTATVDFNSDDAYVNDLVPKSKEQKELTKCIAMDCEMVGVHDGKESVLARVSLVNQHGVCVYDRFVKPKERVADFRTKVSGIRPGDLKRAEDFEVVQKEVAAILNGRILVGHAVHHDLKVLMFSHPPSMIRDTSRFKPFRSVTQGRTPGLKKLASEILGVTIQSGEHSSIEDAKATMQLYNLYQKEWEGHRQQKKGLRRKKAIEAAAGKHSATKTKQEKVTNNQLLDEFVAF